MQQKRFEFQKKKRVVVKIGSSSLNHEETGRMNLTKLERLVRELCDLRNRGFDVCLVSSGAIAAGDCAQCALSGADPQKQPLFAGMRSMHQQ